MPYGGVIACRLNQSWDWIAFPLSVCKLSKDSETYAAIYEQFFAKEYCVESTAFSCPLFVCTDNAVTILQPLTGDSI